MLRYFQLTFKLSKLRIEFIFLIHQGAETSSEESAKYAYKISCCTLSKIFRMLLSRNLDYFTNAELSKLGKFSDKGVDIDLSRISSDELNTLLNTLKMRGKKGFQEISLNFDLYMRAKAKQKSTMQSKMETKTTKSRIGMPAALAMSAIGRRKTLTKDIADVLAEIISESKTLLRLNLRSITFTQSEIGIISNSFLNATSLRSLHFCDIPMGDSGFELLVKALKKELITDLQCRKCRLTDASSRALHSLISFHVSVQSETIWKYSLSEVTTPPLVCISKLDLRDNEFTYNMIRAIHDAILDLPITLLDLRGNIGITSSVVEKLQKEIPHTEIKTGISAPIRGKKQKKQTTKTKNLAQENAKLRGLANSIKRGSEIVEIMPDLAIIGPRANELADHIRKLDKILSSWTNGPKPFFKDNEPEIRNISHNRTANRKKSVPRHFSPHKNINGAHNNNNRRSMSVSRRRNGKKRK